MKKQQPEETKEKENIEKKNQEEETLEWQDLGVKRGRKNQNVGEMKNQNAEEIRNLWMWNRKKKKILSLVIGEEKDEMKRQTENFFSFSFFSFFFSCLNLSQIALFHFEEMGRDWREV